MGKRDSKRIIFMGKAYEIDNPKEVIEVVTDTIKKYNSIGQHETIKQVNAIKNIKSYINAVLGETALKENITFAMATEYLVAFKNLLTSKLDNTDNEEVL